MNAARISEEQLRALHLQFLSDRRLATLQNEIAAIYSRSIPKGMIIDKEGGIVEIHYDEIIVKEVARIRSIINDIIKREYSLLFTEQ